MFIYCFILILRQIRETIIMDEEKEMNYEEVY